jgi:hypothetical protein
MPGGLDRFLRHRTNIASGPALGRVCAVIRESWRLDADPRQVPPEIEVLAARRTAGEAADLAREAAGVFRRNGYHKPSRAWWGADETTFHRFRVRSGPSRAASAVLLGSGLAAVAALAVGAGLRRRARRSPAA